MTIKDTSVDNKIIARAVKDPAFRKQLVANPKATLEKEFGLKVPANVTLQVHEEGDDVRHIVLPQARAKQSVELSDEQLEAAAGGMRGEDCCCTCGSSTHQSLYTSHGP
jgi:hypothetical protein